jgi:dimethylargininase
VRAPGTLDGGDVFRLGRRLFVGDGTRTNAEGVRQLAGIAGRFGFEVVRVAISGCLHLRSACCPISENRVLANPAWLPDAFSTLRGVEVLETPASEPRGANVIAAGGRVLVPSAHAETAELLHREGFEVSTVDSSELAKAESGLTCSSLLFESTPTSR